MLFLNDLIAFLLGQTAGDQAFQRADRAFERLGQLKANVNAPDSVCHRARETIKSETGVETDVNPYLKLDRLRLLACIVASIAQQTRPELIATLWMKEASLSVYSEGELQRELAVANADDAKSMFIALNFFDHMGSDIFTRYKTGTMDNSMLKDGRFASQHRDVLNRAIADLVALGIAKQDYVKVMRDRLTVTGGTGGAPFRVQPEGFYYPAMLSLSMSHFEKLRTQRDALFDEFGLTHPLSDNLTYLFYNNGRGARDLTKKGAFALINSSTARAKAANRGLEDFLLHTKIMGRSWEESRTNIVRFDYYQRCFAPIFA